MKTLPLGLMSMILLVGIAFNANCETSGKATSEKSSGPAFKISSLDFTDGASIPKIYACTGSNYSPAIQWMNPPEKTKSFAMIVDDPDAPLATFTHWVIFNIPAAQTALAEKSSPKGALPSGTLEGDNDFGKVGYGGPCPPPGKPHRYFFKLYALDTMLNLPAGTNKDNLLRAMQGHILGQTQMIGLFAK